MALELQFIEVFIVEGSEFRRRTTKGVDKAELRRDDVNSEAKPRLLRKLESILGLTLHLHERIACRQKVRVQVHAAVCREREVADFIRGLEPAAYQITTSPDMFRPRHDVTSEHHRSLGLKPLQAAFFNQFIGELTESRSGVVIAEK